MRYLLLFLLPFYLFAKPFKVATYNVENLFDAVIQGSEYNEYTPKHHWIDRMVQIKLNHTAEVICDLDADIIGLQEVENETILMRLQQRLKEVGCQYTYRAITHKKDAPIQMALLSRFPIIRTSQLEVSSSPYVRDILEADVQIDRSTLKIFVNHWKSKSREGLESKRIAYAEKLKNRLQKLSRNTDYIILGDFNTDYDASYTLENKINDTQGKTGLHDVLGTTIDEQNVLEGNDPYYTLWKELPVQQRWDTKFYGKKGTPDHIVLPVSMFDGKGIDYVNDTFNVFKRDYLFTKQGFVNRWEYKKGRHLGKGYSDHFPIYALFDRKPYIAKTLQRSGRETRLIEYLYTVKTLSNEVELKDAVVVWKRNNNALIKQTPSGRGIFLYGCAANLQIGQQYDLLITGIQSYHGLKEITQAYVLKEKGSVEIDMFALEQSHFGTITNIQQNEWVKNVSGVYRKGQFYVEGRPIPIYFKKGITRPLNGSKLKIAYALLGYYKKLQLVVYNADDLKILE